MAHIQTIDIEQVDANPFRRLREYPYVERKVEALMRSIKDVGLWEGVIGRAVGNRVQIAFGHHRVEAARRSGLQQINVIVRDLDDDAMLCFMGRENMEDYNSDFLTMLETWEAAVDHLYPSRDGYQSEVAPVAIAQLLGWTQARAPSGRNINDAVQMNRTAEACNSAYTLIQGGYVSRSDLHDMTVNDAREILTRASANMKRLDRMAEDGGRPHKEVEQAKQQVAKAIKTTVEQARDGSVAKRDLRGALDTNTYIHAKEAKVKTPLFAEFGKVLAARIEGMLATDVNAEKLGEMVKVLGIIDTDEDKQIVDRVKFYLGQLSDRADKWALRLTQEKVVPFKAIEGDAK